MQHWQCATCAISLFPDGPVDLFPASPSCCLPAIPTFDLCYLAHIFWGVSKAVIEGDGVNIRDWHFSVIWHHRQHISVQYRCHVLRSSPLDFTASVRRQRTENVGNSFSFLQLNMINCFIAKSLNVRKTEKRSSDLRSRNQTFGVFALIDKIFVCTFFIQSTNPAMDTFLSIFLNTFLTFAVWFINLTSWNDVIRATINYVFLHAFSLWLLWSFSPSII